MRKCKCTHRVTESKDFFFNLELATLFIFQLRVSNSKMKLKKFNLRVSNSKCIFLFIDLKVVKLFAFQLRVSNSKVEKWKLNLRVSYSNFNSTFYEVELVTRKKQFYKNFGVSNSKGDVILRNLVSYLDFVTQEC